MSLTWDTNPRQRLKASGGSQPRIKEGASHHARRGKNAEAFLIELPVTCKTDNVSCSDKLPIHHKISYQSRMQIERFGLADADFSYQGMFGALYFYYTSYRLLYSRK